MLHARIHVVSIVIGVVAVGLAGCTPHERTTSHSRDTGFPELTGPYLGQDPPGLEPEIFAPGIVTTGLFTRDMAVSADGMELYFTVAFSGGSAIMVARETDGRWLDPEVASFSGQYRDFEPCLSADGSRMLFLSNRPPANRPAEPGWTHQNIWAVDRSETGWGEPFLLPPPVSTDDSEFYPSLTDDGTLYFTRGKDDQHATIYRSRLENGQYRTVEELGPEVNAVDLQYNASIAADESFLLFAATGREDSLGGSDCYIAFRTAAEVWSPAVNLGPLVNDDGACDSAMVTRDGRYLFFMSTRRDPEAHTVLTGLTLRQLQERLTRPGNGSADIYWVDAKLIEALRP